MPGFDSYLPAVRRAHAATRRVIKKTGCQLGSSLLALELLRRGEQVDYVEGLYCTESDHQHWWVEAGGVLLDPTRDQFGEDPFAETYAGRYSGEDRKTGSKIENEVYAHLQLHWSSNYRVRAAVVAVAREYRLDVERVQRSPSVVALRRAGPEQRWLGR